ncbi:MAG: hypothetical protein PHW04_15585 [Candidatus Wallbacteria bacterium]|nr:hypothetical protein [Candidatus Wallbacteria bacterium]
MKVWKCGCGEINLEQEKKCGLCSKARKKAAIMEMDNQDTGNETIEGGIQLEKRPSEGLDLTQQAGAEPGKNSIPYGIKCWGWFIFWCIPTVICFLLTLLCCVTRDPFTLIGVMAYSFATVCCFTIAVISHLIWNYKIKELVKYFIAFFTS